MTQIPLAAPASENEPLAEELDAAMGRVRSSGRFVLGPEVEAFEDEFARFVGARFAIGVGSGTDALMLALAAREIGPGDEVITASHTSGATATAILRTGATPVLVDVDARTLTLDPAAVEQAVGPKTRAIVPVHLYGGAADLDPIAATAQRHGLTVVEDCAQAHGTLHTGAHVGSRFEAGAFSFYPTKTLGGLGDGGAVVTSDPALFERLRSLRQYGWERPQLSERPGWNSRLDELQAAVLRVKLTHLPGALAARRAIADAYRAGLEAPGIVHPAPGAAVEHSYHLYVIRCAARDQLAAGLHEAGIGTGIHYRTPVHAQPGFRACRVAGSLAETERAVAEILSLPIYPGLQPQSVERVTEAVNALTGC